MDQELIDETKVYKVELARCQLRSTYYVVATGFDEAVNKALAVDTKHMSDKTEQRPVAVSVEVWCELEAIVT